MKEDDGAVTVSGQHVWGILDTNMEKQINSDAKDCHLINKHILIFRTFIRHPQLYGLHLSWQKAFVALPKKSCTCSEGKLCLKSFFIS